MPARRRLAVPIAALSAAVVLALAVTLTAAPQQDDDILYRAYVLGLAADPSEIFTPTPEPGPDVLPATFELQGGCVNAPGHPYSVVGYEIESAPEDFFYAHLQAYESEPFTHTGLLAIQGSGPGGWSHEANAPVVDGIANFHVPLPDTPGSFTFEILPNPDIVVVGPPVVFNLPDDCVQFDLQQWSSLNVPFPLQGRSTATWHSGNCPGFPTVLEFTISSDGTIEFYQPDTQDLNVGTFWPAPGGGFGFVVRNPNHPEAYAGVIAHDFSSFSGNSVWNHECFWLIDGLIDGIITY